MIRCEYKGVLYTVKELSELSGIAPATIRDRMRRGYSVEEAVKIVSTNESVREFSEASHWKDWIGMSTNDLHKIYWKWCISNGYTPSTIISFSRHLLQMHPYLKVVPIRINDKSYRVIRGRT